MESRASLQSDAFRVDVPCSELAHHRPSRKAPCLALLKCAALLLLLAASGAIVYALHRTRQELFALKQTLPDEIHSAVVNGLQGFQVGAYDGRAAHSAHSEPETGKPSAHLTVRAWPAGAPPRPAPGNVSWEATPGASFLRNGLILHQGHVRVAQDGHYFIYSQVYLHSTSCGPTTSPATSGDSGADHVLVHAVKRKAPSYDLPQVLMQAVESRCGDAAASETPHQHHQPHRNHNHHHHHPRGPQGPQSPQSPQGQKKPWFSSSYQGGVFRLEAGDHIYVTVSDLSLVSDGVDKTYFGLFML